MAMTHDFYLVGVLKTLVDVRRYLAKFWLTLPKKKFIPFVFHNHFSN